MKRHDGQLRRDAAVLNPGIDLPDLDGARCAETDSRLWFPQKGQRADSALAVCGGCEVRLACLEYALADPSLSGVWGGMTENDRRQPTGEGRVRHDCPHVMRSRQGCWAACRCGWTSEAMTTSTGASVAWAEHVRDTGSDQRLSPAPQARMVSGPQQRANAAGPLTHPLATTRQEG